MRAGDPHADFESVWRAHMGSPMSVNGCGMVWSISLHTARTIISVEKRTSHCVGHLMFFLQPVRGW